MKPPTIADIARRAGVSKGAVSYALNGHAGVSESTRQRVLAIAEELGWRPNTAARALSGAPAYAVGLVLRRPARILGIEPYFMELISGIEGELSGKLYALTLQVVSDINAEIAVYRRWWAERRVDGAILIDLCVEDPRIPLLQSLNLPAVIVGHWNGSGRLAAVSTDDGAALTETVEYLAALGHRRIARVTGIPDLLHTSLRDDAFRETCARLGLDEAVMLPADYTMDTSARLTRRLLSGSPRPTAIMYDNDVMAVAGLAVAQEMNVAVPGDLSIVAWDDSPLCRLAHPPLTTLGRDITAYGAHAARILLAAIAGQPQESIQEETPRLIPRGSTAPPRPVQPRPAMVAAS